MYKTRVMQKGQQSKLELVFNIVRAFLAKQTKVEGRADDEIDQSNRSIILTKAALGVLKMTKTSEANQ